MPEQPQVPMLPSTHSRWHPTNAACCWLCMLTDDFSHSQIRLKGGFWMRTLDAF